MRYIPAAKLARHPQSTRPELRSAGFTIVELMIATVVFSVVLLVITYGVLHFTNDYYQGVNSSTTQSTAQNALDTVSQAIQFSATGTTSADSTHFCAGSMMFLYNRGKEFNGSPSGTNRGLYMVPATGSCSDPGGVPGGGTELLNASMRVSDVSLTEADPDTNLWEVHLRIVYGDDDLLRSPGGTVPAASAADASCKLQTGSQFCAVADLTTTAQQRLQ